MTGAGWYVEGVARCPDCETYFDFDGSVLELQKFTDQHECTAKGLDHASR